MPPILRSINAVVPPYRRRVLAEADEYFESFLPQQKIQSRALLGSVAWAKDQLWQVAPNFTRPPHAARAP